MTIIQLDPEQLYCFEVNGTAYRSHQLEAALNCATIMAEVNAYADPDNGGDSHMDWDHIDPAFGEAEEAMGEARMAEINSVAKLNNDFEEDDDNEDEED